MKGTVHEMTWKWLCRRNVKRETELQLVSATQNNVVKARADKTQEDGKIRLHQSVR